MDHSLTPGDPPPARWHAAILTPMDQFEVRIDRHRWADMRRNSRIGLWGATAVGLAGGAWLIVSALIGPRQAGLVPGTLLVLLGLGAALTLLHRRSTTISTDGPPVLFRLDRDGIRLDPGEGAEPLTRPWGRFTVSWLHSSGSYLEVAPDGDHPQRWPVIVTDAGRAELADAIADLSDGQAKLS